MFSKSSAALAAFVFLQQLSSSSAQSSSSTYSADQSTSTACPSQGGAHIIVSRGSLEVAPYGVQVAVKDRILALVPGSTADGTIGYPNTLADYFNSETAGALEARGLITDYVSRCPGLPLVVMGYSQGANVLGDALIGQDDQGFADNSTIDQPLPDSTLAQVAAVVFLGDPTFVTSETFHVGTATMPGRFPRQNAANFDATGLSSRAQSYCDADDLFCADGQSLAVHVSYLPTYSDPIVAFVVKEIAAWYAANPSASKAASATGVASATTKPASAIASASASISACKSAASKSLKSMTASGTGAKSSGVSASVATASVTASATSSTPAASTGGASSFGIDMTTVAGAGAILVGFFAAML